MPNAFRTIDGTVRAAGQHIPLTLPDGSLVLEKWAGSAKAERLDWWLRRGCGNRLAHTEPVAAIGTAADDDNAIIWADAPPQARAFFVIVAPEPGKNYRIARLVTAAASPALTAWIRHDRFALLGVPGPDGGFRKLAPPDPSSPPPRPQAELF